MTSSVVRGVTASRSSAPRPRGVAGLAECDIPHAVAARPAPQSGPVRMADRAELLSGV